LDRDKNDKEEVITIEIEEGTAEFEKNIEIHKKARQMWKERTDSATNPADKAFFALATIMEDNHVSSLWYHQYSIENIITLSTNLIDITTKISQMEKEIQALQARTGTDITNLSESFEALRNSALESLRKISKHLSQKAQQELDDEKQRKLEAEILDWALRSR
jgi:hypothetical protein